MPWSSSVHRGSGYKSRLATAAYEGARGAVAEFVGARDGTVVLVRNTTEAINVLSAALPAGTRVLSTAAEHHANMLPWRRHDVTVLPIAGQRMGARGALRARAAGGAAAHRPRRRHRRLERHRRGVAAGRARRGRPSLRRGALRRCRPAGPASRHRHGADGDRLPRAVGPQALRAVRRRRAGGLRPGPRARRAAAARRRGDRAGHARRRRVGRRARALRGGLAQRGGGGGAGGGVPHPRPGGDAARRGARARAVRAPGGGPRPRAGTAAARAVERPDRRSRGAGHLRARGLPPPAAGRDPERRARHRRAPRLLLRAPAPGPPARRAGGRARCPARGAPLRRAPGHARGRAGQLRARDHGAGHRPPGRRPGRDRPAAGRAGATCATARTTSTGRHPTCAPCRGRRATSRRPPTRRRGRSGRRGSSSTSRW